MKSVLKVLSICFLVMFVFAVLPLSCLADETSEATLNALIQEAISSDGASTESCAEKLGTSFLSDPHTFIHVLSTWDGETQEAITSMVVYDQNGPHNPDFQLAVARLEQDPNLADVEYATVMLMQALCVPSGEETGPEAPTTTGSEEVAPVPASASAAQPPQTSKRPLYWAIGLALFGVFFAIFAFKGISKL